MSFEKRPLIGIWKKFGKPLVLPLLPLLGLAGYFACISWVYWSAGVGEGGALVIAVSLFVFTFAFVRHHRRSRDAEYTRRIGRAREQAITIYASVVEVSASSFEFRYDRGRGIAEGPFQLIGEATDVLPGDQVSIDGLCDIEPVPASGYRGEGDETRVAFRGTPSCPVRVQRLSWR